MREAPRVGGIVEHTHVDDGPVHEAVAPVMRVAIVVEDVDDRKFADREGQAIGVDRAAEQILARVDRLALAAEPDRLAREIALEAHIGPRVADLVGLGAWKAREPQRAREAIALVDLGIDVSFAALPQAHAEIARGRVGRADLAVRRQAVLPAIERIELRIALRDYRALCVEAVTLLVGRVLRRGRIDLRGFGRRGRHIALRRPRDVGPSGAGVSCGFSSLFASSAFPSFSPSFPSFFPAGFGSKLSAPRL